MITFIVGRPRGGKSYFAVRQVCRTLRLTERQVVTNLPLHLDKLAEWCHENIEKPVDLSKRVRILKDEEVMNFWRYEVRREYHADKPHPKENRTKYANDKYRKPGQQERTYTVPDFEDRQEPANLAQARLRTAQAGEDVQAGQTKQRSDQQASGDFDRRRPELVAHRKGPDDHAVNQAANHRHQNHRKDEPARARLAQLVHHTAGLAKN